MNDIDQLWNAIRELEEKINSLGNIRDDRRQDINSLREAIREVKPVYHVTRSTNSHDDTSSYVSLDDALEAVKLWASKAYESMFPEDFKITFNRTYEE
jgi:DNA gyrase/topoisomerase IV subunit A